MQMTNGQLKALARKSMKGKYGDGAVICLLVYLCLSFSILPLYFLVAVTSLLFAWIPIVGIYIGFILILAVYIVFSNIIIAGSIRHFHLIAAGQPYRMEDMFHFFRYRLKDITKFSLLYYLIIFGINIILTVIGIVISAIAYTGTPDSLAIILIVIPVYLLATFFITMALTLRYALIYLVLGEREDLTLREVVERSTSLMDGNKKRLIILFLSFIGWYILGAISFGIGYLWIMPYIACTFGHLYEDIKAEKDSPCNTQRNSQYSEYL